MNLLYPVLASGTDGADAAYDDDPAMDSQSVPGPLFVSLLIANRWFLRPLAFAQKKNGPTPQQRIKIAMVRLAIFATLRVAAFASLPTLPVAAVLAGRIAWITPKIRCVNNEFQSISDA